jgi:AraC-like DNA-binding protein
MQILCLPNKQLFSYVLTGKFKAPSDEWKHDNFLLTDYELIVMTEGVLYLSYNNENFTVKKGEYLLLPPSNSWRQGFKPAYCSFYWLHFTTIQGDLPIILSPDSIMPPDDRYFTIPQMGTVPKSEKLVVLMKQLQDIVKSGYPSIALDSMSTSILAELFGQLSLLSPIANTSDNQKQIYLDIIDYIKRNISSNLKVSDIASTFGYNEKYLSHRFVEIAGIPLKQYILKTKIESANFMLTDTNKSIAEISKDLGFSDSHNFSRTYKNITGLSPSEYRDAFSKRLLYNV